MFLAAQVSIYPLRQPRLSPAIDKALDKKVKSVYTTVPIFSGSGFGLGLIDEGDKTIL